MSPTWTTSNISDKNIYVSKLIIHLYPLGLDRYSEAFFCLFVLVWFSETKRIKQLFLNPF